MDEPDSLAALQTPDDATRYFTPWGLAGGLLQPEDSVRHLRGSLSRAQLAAQIPDEVRANFARLRKLFLYGLMEYEFFSAASTLTPLVLEGALGAFSQPL